MISVVIPIYISKPESFSMTERCISLAKEYADSEVEWIIVETESDLFKDYADIHIYEKNRTTATKSINRGFRVASGEYVVLLTNDVMVSPGWLERLKECFDKIKDCGISTLATTQLYHTKQDKIEEGIWFSVAMFKRQSEYFDEGYVNSWDDSDFIMRKYIDGKKMYRNFNCVVEHNPGSTHYEDTSHKENYDKNRERFINKFKEHKDNRMYKILVEGWII